MADWIRNVPNDGLIRYYMVGNLERVLLTSPKTLSEVLVHKAYDFCKPELVQLQLRRVTGNGLLLAEGDEHKVRLPQYRFLLSCTNCTSSYNARTSCQRSPTAMSKTSTRYSGLRAPKWPT